MDRANRNQARMTSAPRARLWVKLLLAYLVSTLVILAGIGYLAYRAARVSMEDQLGKSLMAVARTAANLVGRPRALRLLPGEKDSRTYQNLRQKLAELKQAFRVESITLFDRGGRALVDSDGRYAIHEPIVKLAADRAELKDVFGGRSRSSVLFAGKGGRLYKTGFAPVRLEGKVVAAVGVDGSASFFGPLGEMSQALALVGVLAVIMIVLITLLVSRRITRPLGRLAQSARAIGGGELDREITVETSDEIGILADTLNEMRKSIQERDRQLQMMLSGIAHEVRNPLGGMALFVGLLSEELAGNQTAIQHLKRIGTELDYLSRVVGDFLDFARERPLEYEELDPRVELEQIKSLAAADLEKAGVTLEFEVDRRIGKVCWDRERLRRSLLNLVQNAIQASPPGGAILVSLEPQDQELVLTVSDQGDGIPADKRERIFEPFFTSRQQGTGLGLALVKNTVEAHDGTIHFESGPETGTSFVVSLPARKESR